MTQPIRTGYHAQRRPKRNPAPLGLTNAEWRIVQAICNGCDSRAELAERFGLSRRTIDTHTHNIETKLKTDNRLGVVLRVLHDDNARRLCWTGLRIEEVST
jgi:DNA-binding CsgD family transcriptional regulator